jgi:fibronectin-binding autotransporter adhesin
VGKYGNPKLFPGIGCAALIISCWLTPAASAADYAANSQGTLDDAIRTANAAGDTNAVITLTGNFSVNSTSLATPTTPVTIDTQGFTLSGSDGSGAAGTPIILSGSGSTFILLGNYKGGNSDTAGGGQGLQVRLGASVINNGMVDGGTSLTGAGGVGVDLGGPGAAATLVNNGTIRGGTGATAGGVGLQVRAGSNPIVNTGTIEGGTGAQAIRTNGTNVSLNLTNSGTISAGTGQADAITLSAGTTNGITLELQAGSVIEGNVVGNAAATNDTLRLGGSGSDSFDVSTIGPQYQNFDTFEKTGTGTWLLTGTATATTNWTISDGTLLVGDHSAATSVIGDITNFGTLGGSGTIFGDVLNSGTVTPGNSIGTLTISGDYTSNNGALDIQSVLGGDASSTDRLVVTGNTAGATTVKVTNLGGTGARTVEGMEIVDVGGVSTGTFTLQGDYVFEGDQAVVGGAYAYRLYKNGVSTPDDGDWYLRSTLVSDPAAAGASSAPLYQPGVPIYEAYPQMLLALNALPTLQQRLGNRFWSRDDQASAGMGADGAWLRTEGTHGSVEPDGSTSDTSYDYDLWKMQAGIDEELYQNSNGRLLAGLMAQYGTISGNVNSVYGDGKIDTSGYGVGATLTWYGDSGLYVDAQSQATWYDSDLKSSALDGDVKNGNEGFGYAFSLETGKRFEGAGSWAMTPQAQLIYSSVDFDGFNDRFGAQVSSDRGDSLSARVGLALDRKDSWQTANGRTAQGQLYGAANLYSELLNGTTVDVSDTGIESKNDRLSAGLTLGGSYDWNDERFSIYGEVAAKSSLKNFGDSYTVSGTAGIRVKW